MNNSTKLELKDYSVPGYSFIETQAIPAIGSVGVLFEHVKSGAKVAFVVNEDTNKTFSISFRTPPTDDTGVAHILEHSVLCGSAKYPVKDPFVELAKGSLNTFLNAMTYSDKTVYPVASCNDKDFENLTDVYLDAVLHPNIYQNAHIFEQEGWHHELLNEEDPVIYKGVVYNEMKGTFSSPEQVLFRKIQQTLFPNSPYGFESGGDPDAICSLTFENFLAFHESYYHPSNSYIFFYGNVDVAAKLSWLDERYLSAFDKKVVDSEIPVHAPFEKREYLESYYPISAEEEEADQTYFSMNYVVGKVTDAVHVLGVEILEYLMLEAPGAPLKQALVDAKIGMDIFGSFDDSILQPTLSIVCKNANEEKQTLFVETIEKELSRIAEEGFLDKKVEAAVNYFEFRVREGDYGRAPKGVIYSIKTLESWLYGENPFGGFDFDTIFTNLRAELANGLLQKIVKEDLLNNPHSTVLTLKPSKTMLSEREGEIEQELTTFKVALSKEEIQALIRNNESLNQFQSIPESAEALASIPLLERSDIPVEQEPLKRQVTCVADTTVVEHYDLTNGIVYEELAFDVSDFEVQDIPVLSFMTKLLGNIRTSQHSYSELSDEVNLSTGGIDFDTKVFMKVDDAGNSLGDYIATVGVSGKSFVNKTERLGELIGEMILMTQFDEESRLYELLSETRSRLQMSLMKNGHQLAIMRAESYISEASMYLELQKGITFYETIVSWHENFEAKKGWLIERLTSVYQNVFQKNRLTTVLTTESAKMTEVVGAYTQFLNVLGESKSDKTAKGIQTTPLTIGIQNEGFKIPSKVQYVAQIGKVDVTKNGYSGKLKVLQSILSLDYLWPTVRVQGGAYGAMCGFKRSGGMYLVSYRDPNLVKTFENYQGISTYLCDFEADEREMTKYIIGTISSVDQPLTPSLKGEKVMGVHLSNLSDALVAKERAQILSTEAKDIVAYATWIEEALSTNILCVVGNENMLEEEKNLFQALYTLK